MIELSGGSAFFAKLWSAKGGREGRARERKKKAKKRSDKNGGKRKGKCWEVPLQIMIVLTGKKRRRRKGKKRWRWCLACAPSVEASYLRGRNIFLSEKKSALLFFCFFQSFMAFSPPPRNSYFNNPSASFHLSVPEISIRYGSSVACGRRSTREKYKIYPKIASQRTQKNEKNGYCFSFASFSFSNPFPSPHFCPS